MISKIKQVAAFLLFIGGSLFTQAQTRYNLYDLGPIVGTNSSAEAINNAGNLAGYTYTNGGFSAFSCISNQVSLVSGLGSIDDRAVSINNSNHLTINSLTNGQYYPFLYNNGSLTGLGDWGGTNTFITGMDDFDDIIGYVESTNGVTGVFYNGQPLSLGDLGGGISYPWGINNFGLVVGSSALPGGQMHACYFTTNGPVDLNATYASNNITLLSAEAVNNQNVLTGWATTNTAIQPFLIDTNGLTLLPIPAGSSNAYSLAINGAETIVGSCDTSNGSHAAIWQNGNGYDLNSLLSANAISAGWQLNQAVGINDKNQILVAGFSNAVPRSALLSPHQQPTLTITSPTNLAYIGNASGFITLNAYTTSVDDSPASIYLSWDNIIYSQPLAYQGPSVIYNNQYYLYAGQGTNSNLLIGYDSLGNAAISPGTHVVKALLIDDFGSVTAQNTFSVAPPTSGLVCWLKPESLAPGTLLTNWLDSSGFGNNATVGASSAPAVVGNLLSGYPGAQFNGTNSYLNLPAILTGATGLEAFFVVRANGASSGALWHCSTNYPEGSYSTSAIIESAGHTSAITSKGAPAGFNIYHVQSGSGEGVGILPNSYWRVRVNGNIYAQDTSYSMNFTNLCIGRNWVGNNSWTYGSPAVIEVLIYKTSFSSELIARSIGTYLNSKYHLDTNLPVPFYSITATSLTTPAAVVASCPESNNVCSFNFNNVTYWGTQTTYPLSLPYPTTGAVSYTLTAKNYVGIFNTNITLPSVSFQPAGTTYVPIGTAYTLFPSTFSGTVGKVVWWMDGAPLYTITNYPWALNLNSSNIAFHTLIPQVFDQVGNNRYVGTFNVNFIDPVDSDGDGVPDYLDPYPYDISLTNNIPGITNTFTAPIITITEP